MPEKTVNVAVPVSSHKKLKRIAASKKPQWKLVDAAAEAIDALEARESRPAQPANALADHAT